jgi:tetratricopeptide (TPR) repeat protein
MTKGLNDICNNLENCARLSRREPNLFVHIGDHQVDHTPDPPFLFAFPCPRMFSLNPRVNNDPKANSHVINASASKPGGQLFSRIWVSIGQTLNNSESRLRFCLGAAFIFALVLIVYRPILPGGFVIDDESLVGRDNPLVNGTYTPWTIWFQTDFTLATFGWWLQRLVWGVNPAGYHAVGLVLHVISGILIWRVLARLKIPGAWLAAVLFVAHPVCVNSVARISELKNTLSLPFFLFAFLGYLHYEAVALYSEISDQPERHPSRSRATLWYVFSLIAFVLSLLSKTTSVMLPVLLLACAAWQRRRITRRDMLHTIPFFILSVAFGLMSVWFQKHQALVAARLSLQSTSFSERLAGAGQDFWFYFSKVFWPVDLSVVYPAWKLEPGSFAACLPALLAVAFFVLCWCFRRSWGRPVLFAIGCFAISLFPALGFFDAQFLTMGRVSDHLQYLPMIALVALATAGLASLPGKTIFRCAAVLLILILSFMSFQRARVFASQESLARDTLTKNPAAWTSYNDLGIVLAKRGDYDAAIHELQNALRCNPDYADARLNLGLALMLQGKPAEAQPEFLAVLKVKPYEPLAHRQLAEILQAEGKDQEALYHLKVALLFKPDAETHMALATLFYKTGDARSAVEQLHRALALKPDQVDALNNLAWILATGSEGTVRNGREAVSCAERACQLTDYKQSALISTLAAAYAEAGRFPEAVITAERAVQMQAATGETGMADMNNQLLILYRSGKPYHSSPANNASR